MALLLWTWSEEVDKSDCLNYDGIAIMDMIRGSGQELIA